MEQRSGKGEAMIFRAHQALILDPELQAEVHAEIEPGIGFVAYSPLGRGF